MAQHGHPQPGRGPAVVGVRVAQHDPLDPAELRARPVATARVIVRAPASNTVTPPSPVVLDQVHVAPARLALHHPHALGHELCLGARQPCR